MGEQSFLGWFGIGGVWWSDSVASSGIGGISFVQGLVVFRAQGPQGLVGFSAEGLWNLTL